MKQQRYFSKMYLAKKLCLLAVFFLAVVPTILAQPKRATVHELKKIMDKQENFLIVDVRGLKSYEKSHLPGAISLPIRELVDRHRELPRNEVIVFYCS
ncbi:MAG: rhodanese-like domain-containing protein [Candidatus Poribacteria bacterium]|jgi:3-mercaptopyruvate sulfurtransferase SseA|nr:rhodanese-like domain-containing protein [Candidatus Poribacteria bacterium]|tara:strand:+ start:1017 stop:1310 length:294 start_codon:yes stop_codon:yes gene_type:complete